MSEEAVTSPEASKYQELEEGDFNEVNEFFIKKEDGAYEKVTKTGEHTYEKGKYFKEKEQSSDTVTTETLPAAGETSPTPNNEQVAQTAQLVAAVMKTPEVKSAINNNAAAGPAQAQPQPEAAGPATSNGGRRRTKRKQQKKGGKSAKKGGKKHRKSSGKKSRRSSSKKSRRYGRK
jgi:hypothetical protein